MCKNNSKKEGLAVNSVCSAFSLNLFVKQSSEGLCFCVYMYIYLFRAKVREKEREITLPFLPSILTHTDLWETQVTPTAPHTYLCFKQPDTWRMAFISPKQIHEF